jgi:hypothetical protein
MTPLTERYADRLRGVLSCFDRVVITGTLPDICYAEAMAARLRFEHVRLFDFTRWAHPLRECLRKNAERLAQENGLQIEFIRRKDFRKEERVKAIVARRGEHPGLVHIFAAMEPCPSFQPWHDKATGRTFLKPKDAKCLHYYFYFIDQHLGLCYLRVPTWVPFRLQFYFNGHQALARRLRQRGMRYTLAENAFLDLEDFATAQKLADTIRVDRLHRQLDQFARRYCPVVSQFRSGYHWSLMQVEYATDLVFRRPDDLGPLYEALTRTAIHAVKPDQVATFLGRKLHGLYQGDLGTDFHTRVEGTRIKHHMGPASIKMYDKLGLVLRLETTANDVSFFKHHRRVEQREGGWVMQDAPVKKSIYSLPVLRGLMGAANQRYLQFLATLDDPTSGLRDLDTVSRPVNQGDRSYRGFNLFHGEDLDLFRAIVRGEFNISGFTNRRLRAVLADKNGPQISRLLKRLRLHGLAKRIGRTYKYYLTRLGRRVVALALRLREMFIIPSLAHPPTIT